jgi:hypothetical protein
MSVKSVRAAVTAALSDKKITSLRPRPSPASRAAPAASSTEKTEIAKALSAKAKWAPQAHLAANVTAPPMR